MLIMTHDDNYYVYNCWYDTLTRLLYCSNVKHDNVHVEELRDDHAGYLTRDTDSSLLITYLIILIRQTYWAKSSAENRIISQILIGGADLESH